MPTLTDADVAMAMASTAISGEIHESLTCSRDAGDEGARGKNVISEGVSHSQKLDIWINQTQEYVPVD